MVQVLVLLFVALWFILRGDLCQVLPCVILFLCFSVLLALRLPRLGKRELILVHFVRLFDLRLLGFVCFSFLLASGKGCGCDCGTPRTFLLLFLHLHMPWSLTRYVLVSSKSRTYIACNITYWSVACFEAVRSVRGPTIRPVQCIDNLNFKQKKKKKKKKKKKINNKKLVYNMHYWHVLSFQYWYSLSKDQSFF